MGPCLSVFLVEERGVVFSLIWLVENLHLSRSLSALDEVLQLPERLLGPKEAAAFGRLSFSASLWFFVVPRTPVGKDSKTTI